ncbi:MAG TPA: VOC family protein [Acidimicrobiales bacterium]|nr:VOC family protein [Acidimicrobiales bacterium]
MRIKLAAVFVDDQDKARRIYTEALGFQVKTDVDLGEGGRWLTVVSPEDPDGTELLLEPPDDAAASFQEHLRTAGKPATSFTTDDCRRTYEELSASGVRFVTEPTKMPYGGTDAVFEDGCGNLINVHQD